MTQHVTTEPLDRDRAKLVCARCGAERLVEGDPAVARRDFEREHQECESPLPRRNEATR